MTKKIVILNILLLTAAICYAQGAETETNPFIKYGIVGLMIYLLFKDVVRPIIASLTKKTQPEEVSPISDLEKRVINLENGYKTIKEEMDTIKERMEENAKSLTKIDRMIYGICIALNVDIDKINH